MIHSAFAIAVLLLFVDPIAAQKSFHLDEHFKHPTKIPGALVPLLRAEVKSHCPDDPDLHAADVRKLFSAARISLGRPVLILKSGGRCLTGGDNDWFWMSLKTRSGYRKILTGGSISLNVLKQRTHGLRDIGTSACTGAYCFAKTYKFDGSIYRLRICEEAEMPGPPKWHRVPCRQ